MSQYLYIADEAGDEIPGSRRAADYHGDRAAYFRIREQLLRSAGEGCSVKDSEIDG